MHVPRYWLHSWLVNDPDYLFRLWSQVSSLVELHNGDIFDVPLAGSSVIIVYLFREVRSNRAVFYAKLCSIAPWFVHGMHDGAVVVELEITSLL